MKIYLGGHNASVPLHNASVPLVAGTEISLVNAFLKAGFETCDRVIEADAIVFIEMDTGLMRKIKKFSSDRIPIIFVRYEPIVVWPENYNAKAIALTSKLIDVGRISEADNPNFPWPQDWDQNLKFREVVSTRNESVALINGNKLSFIKGEMYSIRRECIFGLQNFDVYGMGWDLSLSRKILIFIAEIKLATTKRIWPKLSNSRGWLKRPTNWIGAPNSKLETLSKYKYSLVIENSMDYMTEKLFDALFARCIPVYVGPAVSKFEIPEFLVVQVDPDLASIKKGIAVAQAMDYENWKAELNAWLLQDEVFNKWSAANVYEAIVTEASICIKDFQS